MQAALTAAAVQMLLIHTRARRCSPACAGFHTPASVAPQVLLLIQATIGVVHLICSLVLVPLAVGLAAGSSTGKGYVWMQILVAAHVADSRAG